ncbi:MAG: transglutaminaseTgpA domain-containing protein [Sulfurihydrogenibium sp.]
MFKNLTVDKLVKINAYVGSITAYGIVFSKLSVIYSILFLFLFFVGLYRDFYRPFNISRLVLNILGIGFVLMMILQINPENIVQPAIDTITALLGLKLLEEKKFRDYMQIFLMITLILSGYTLLSISMLFLLYLVFYTFFLNYGIILLSFYGKDPNMQIDQKQLKSLIVKTSVIPLLAIPMTVFLFFILPRTNYPMLNFLQAQGKGKTGFSDKVSLGDVSSIQQDNSVVARVVMPKVSNELYLRGLVLDYFDGRNWDSKNVAFTYKPTRFYGNKISYIIYLEPTYQQYILTVDVPYTISQPSGFLVFKYPDFTYKVDKPITSKIRYEGESILTNVYQQTINPSIYLQIPNLSDDIKTLAEKLKKDKPEKTAREIFNYLQTFSYSLENLPVGSNPLEDFLFKYKKGNCEFFASAMAVLLRVNGIPSRLVVGYKTTDYNTTGGYYIFREKDAHVWVEAYIDGQWIKYDPTPPVRNLIVEQLYKKTKIKEFFELVDYYYTTFIVNYDFSKQVELVNKIKSGLTTPKFKESFEFNKNLVVLSIGFALFVYLIITILKHQRKTYEEKLLEMFLKKMKKYGYIKSENEGLEEFVSKIDKQEIRETALNFVRQYENFVFKDKKISKEDYLRLSAVLESL